MVQNWFCSRVDVKSCFLLNSFIPCHNSWLLFFSKSQWIVLKLTKSFPFVSFSLHYRKIFYAEEKYGGWDMVLISTLQITSLLFRSTSQLKPRPWKRRTTRESQTLTTIHKSLARDWRFISHLIGKQKIGSSLVSSLGTSEKESSVTRVVLCDSHLLHWLQEILVFDVV